MSTGRALPGPSAPSRRGRPAGFPGAGRWRMGRSTSGSPLRIGRWRRCPRRRRAACRRPRREARLPDRTLFRAAQAFLPPHHRSPKTRHVPRPEYPRPSLRRSRWVNLNGEWEFGAGAARKFDRRITVPFAPQSQLSGGRVWEPSDVVWYRRRFDAPVADRLLLHVGAVDYHATVWVNGEEVARHEGGHTPFAADVGHVVHEHDNELIVHVEDPLADKTIPRGKQYWQQTT